MPNPRNALWEEMAARLRTAISRGELASGTRLPNEDALAAEHGVSRMTAHRALRRLQEEGFVTRRPRHGTFVCAPPAPAAPTPPRVALLMFGLSRQPHAAYLEGVLAALPASVGLTLCDTRNLAHVEADYLRRLAGNVDGVLAYPTCDPANTPLIQGLLEGGCAVVCMDRAPEGLAVDAVLPDDFEACRKATHALVAEGHRAILYVSDGHRYVSSVAERRAGFEAAMAEAGLADRAIVREYPQVRAWDFGQLAQALEDALYALVSRPDPVTAVFAQNDDLMAGVLAAADRSGLRVPDRISLTAINDGPDLPILDLGLVRRVVKPARRMGELAAETLLGRLAGDARPPRRIELAAEIVPPRALAHRPLRP